MIKQEKDYSYHSSNPENAVDSQVTNNIKNIHTSIPAKVVSFNSANQTVTLQAQIKQLMKDGKTVDIPPLLDVPVSFPRGGGYAVTYPLTAGDEGIALFSERCIDGWHSSGSSTEPMDYRYHDLSDAMFIPGICSVPNSIKGFFTGGLSMQTLDGGTYIRITNGSIIIRGNIQLSGNIAQTGGITSSSDIVASDISLVSHTHGGVSIGSSDTGVPK